MKAVPVITGTVSANGRLQFTESERRGLDMWLSTLIGKRVGITVKVHRNTRSSQQNRYYFGVVVKMLADHCGYEVDEMHEALAYRFLRIEDCPVTGAPRRKRTPDTNTSEFAEYVDACVRFGAELGVVIPDPQAAEAA